MRVISAILSLLLCSAAVSAANAQELASEVAELRTLLTAVQNDYEARISDLETRLARAEQLASGARRDATEAFEIAEQTAIEQSSGTTAANTYNPAVGAVLSGRYASVDQAWDEIPGFPSGV